MRMESAEQINRAINAERKVQELEERLARVCELESVVAYLERKNRYAMEERAVQIHRAVAAEQKIKELMDEMVRLERGRGFAFEV